MGSASRRVSFARPLQRGNRSTAAVSRSSNPREANVVAHRIDGVEVTYEKAWDAAVRNADLQHDDVRLYPFDEAPKDDGYTAMFWDPGSYPDPTGKTGPPLTEAQREHASQNADKYRVAIYTGIPVTAFGAKVRHELEHVRQHKVWGRRLFEVGQAVQVLQYRAVEGKRGAGYLFNLVPSERDANLAASTFARGHFGVTEADVLLETDEAVLLRPGPAPEIPETLGPRQVAFAAIYASEFEAALRDEIHASVEDYFGPLEARVPELWRDLRDDPELRERAARAAAAAPPQDAIDAANRNVGPLWVQAVEATVRAEQRARAVARLAPRPA